MNDQKKQVEQINRGLLAVELLKLL